MQLFSTRNGKEEGKITRNMFSHFRPMTVFFDLIAFEILKGSEIITGSGYNTETAGIKIR